MKLSKIVLICFGVFLISVACFAADGNIILVADFNQNQKVNNLGKGIEVWLQGDGSDKTQTCQMSPVKDDALGDKEGSSVQIDYDVDSPNPAYNGVRTDLGGLDVSGFKTLNFYVKGDAAKGFTKKFKIELIGTGGRPSPYIVGGVTDEWQKVSIPLSEFLLVKDWTSLDKFVVVFADINNDPKVGTIYLDQIYFSKE